MAERDPQPGLGATLTAILCLALAAGAAWLADRQLEPPAALAADSPESSFSALRAFEDVNRLAREPRPPGTAAHRQARRPNTAQITVTTAKHPTSTNSPIPILNHIARLQKKDSYRGPSRRVRSVAQQGTVRTKTHNSRILYETPQDV